MARGMGRTVLVVLAVAILGTATAASVAPIRDSGVSCGAALTAAAHGKVVGPLGTRGHLVVLTKQQQKLLAPANAGLFGLSGNRLPQAVNFMFVVCRTPARHRLALVATALGVSMIALGISWQVFDPRRRAAPIPAP
jgi:hypothetical protein